MQIVDLWAQSGDTRQPPDGRRGEPGEIASHAAAASVGAVFLLLQHSCTVPAVHKCGSAAPSDAGDSQATTTSAGKSIFNYLAWKSPTEADSATIDLVKKLLTLPGASAMVNHRDTSQNKYTLIMRWAGNSNCPARFFALLFQAGADPSQSRRRLPSAELTSARPAICLMLTVPSLGLSRSLLVVARNRRSS